MGLTLASTPERLRKSLLGSTSDGAGTMGFAALDPSATARSTVAGEYVHSLSSRGLGGLRGQLAARAPLPRV
jgi:hypothetical protein